MAGMSVYSLNLLLSAAQNVGEMTYEGLAFAIMGKVGAELIFLHDLLRMVVYTTEVDVTILSLRVSV
jgi:hypothetical protein